MIEFEQLSFFDNEKPLFKIKTPIRLIELFAGVGSQAMALRDLGADFEHYRVVEFDKYDEYGQPLYNETLDIAIEQYKTAIEALEKQLPKEAVKRSLVKDNGIVVGAVGRCPCCNEIIDDTMTVCDCGQKIDWSE